MEINSNALYQNILDVFAPILETHDFPRRTVLHEAGRICPRLYLVESGLLRAHYYLDDRDVTAHFALPGYSITAPDSFITGRPSRYHLEALTDTRAYAVERTALEHFLGEHPQHERLARQFTQLLYLELLDRMESMVFLTARERYDRLVDTCPQVFEHMSLRHIASYLGIAPKTLSRVRAQRAF